MHPLAVWAPVFACCLHRLVKCRTNREMAVSKLCSAAADAVERVGTLADCTLVADDGSRYQVSKAIMALHSRVLGAMFNDISHAEKHVKLDDSAAEVACLVNHVYGGNAFLVDLDNLLQCSRISQKYDMPRLQMRIDAFVKQLQLNGDNVAHYMAIAHDGQGMAMLKERCMDYMTMRLQHIIDLRVGKKMQSTDWLEALPQSTLVELMRLRCRLIGGVIRGNIMKEGTMGVFTLDNEAIRQYEAKLRA